MALAVGDTAVLVTPAEIVMVDPAPDAVTVAPDWKLRIVTPAPNELPPDSISTPPAGSPVKFAPEPTNDVAVTTPVNVALPVAVTVPPTPEAPNSTPPLAVTIPRESTLVTSS